MKLALALSERADIQRRINDLASRLYRNAKVQDGEKPNEKDSLFKPVESSQAYEWVRVPSTV